MMPLAGKRADSLLPLRSSTHWTSTSRQWVSPASSTYMLWIRIGLVSFLFDGHEDRMPHLVVDGFRQMAAAGGVFHEDDFTGTDDAGFAVAGGQFHAGIEVDDVLPAWRGMPGAIMFGLGLAEDDAGGRQTGGGFPLRPLLGPVDLDVAPVRFAL